RRHATNRRIRQAGIAGELGGSPGRYAQIGTRLISYFAGQLHARGQRVIDDAGIELPGKLGCIDPIARVRFGFAPLAADGHETNRVADAVAAGAGGQAAGERLQGGVGKTARRRVAAEAIVEHIARAVGDLEIASELPLDLGGQNVRLGGDNVAQRTGGDAEPGVAVDRYRRHRRAVAVVAWIDQGAGRRAVAGLRQIRPPVVRCALFALVDVPERHLGSVVELRADRRRHAPTPGPDIVAIWRVGFGIKRGDAARNVVALAAGIDIGAITAHGVNRRGALDESLTGRKLRDVVEGAAGRAAAEGERGRSLVDLDTIDVEEIAGAPRGVAEPVA